MDDVCDVIKDAQGDILLFIRTVFQKQRKFKKKFVSDVLMQMYTVILYVPLFQHIQDLIVSQFNT